jgi:nicotinamide-nucleotide amidase
MCSVGGELLEKISVSLQKQNFKIATAESCTGGLIAHTLTNISGSSNYFERGLVTYSNQAKIELLKISEDLIVEYGAVSSQVASAMAEGVRKNSHVDIGIATTGIAGPTGGTKEKPVGLVFIAISTKHKTNVEKIQFKGDRLQNKQFFCEATLKMLLSVLEE